MKWLRAYWKSLTGQSDTASARRPKRSPSSSPTDTDASCSTETPPKALTRSPGKTPDRPTSKPAAKSRASRVSRQSAIIQVGIDFGTSTTKIAFRQVQPNRPVQPLLFDHAMPGVPAFGLPSVAAIDDNGALHVATPAARLLSNEPWWQGMRAFKVLLAAGEANDEIGDLWQAFSDYSEQHSRNGNLLTPETVSYVYLAYAMREARTRISNLPEYAETDVELLFNVCAPMQHVELNPALQAFKEALARAEALERAWPVGAPPEWLAANYTSFVDVSLQVAERAFVIPESVAEAASYVSSLRRRPGLHALIDIGAGTSDVSFFNLKEEGGEQHSYWYSSANLPIGGRALEQVLGSNGQQHCTASEIGDRIADLGRCGDESTVRQVAQVFKDIHMAARPVWSDAFNHLHTEGPWHHLNVFLAGGGAEIPGASDAFREPWWEHLVQQHVHYRVEELPEPDDFDSLDGQAPFSRLAVAYGLTYPEPDLGHYTLPSDCPDHTPPPLPRRPADPNARWV